MTMYFKRVNGGVTEGPTELHPSLVGLSQLTLLSQGWVPIIPAPPALYDPFDQYVTVSYSLGETEATQVLTVNDYAPEELPGRLVELKELMKEQATSHRFIVETGGISMNGSHIRTDRESQSTLAGALAFLNLNPATLINWKGENGWILIDLNTVAFLSSCVGAHVQMCFSKERILHEAIDDCETVDDLRDIDIYDGWPTGIITTP